MSSTPSGRGPTGPGPQNLFTGPPRRSRHASAFCPACGRPGGGWDTCRACGRALLPAPRVAAVLAEDWAVRTAATLGRPYRWLRARSARSAPGWALRAGAGALAVLAVGGTGLGLAHAAVDGADRDPGRGPLTAAHHHGGGPGHHGRPGGWGGPR